MYFKSDSEYYHCLKSEWCSWTTPLSVSCFIQCEHPLVGVEECLDLLGYFSHLLSCFNWFV